MVGIADLPLHYGRVPDYLLRTMREMTDVISHVMLTEFGEDEFIKRLSNPFWFQAFNNAVGMDWDSSGSTTVLLSLLKQTITPEKDNIAILGGKGKAALKVGSELNSLPSIFDVDKSDLYTKSRLSAKTDMTLLQDKHQLYIHSMIVTKSGNRLVIQQGMNPETKFARRYHLYNTLDFENSPNESITGQKGSAMDITAKEVSETRKIILDLLKSNDKNLVSEYREAVAKLKGETTLSMWEKNAAMGAFERDNSLEYYSPISVEKLKGMLSKLKNTYFSSLSDAMLNGFSPSFARAMTLVSDLIYNKPPSFSDPVSYPYDPFKYAFAIGGKDGIPFPVNRKVAVEVAESMHQIIMDSKLGDNRKRTAFRRLSALTKNNV